MKRADGDLLSSLSPFILEGMALMVFLNQLWSEHVSLRLPRIVCRGITLPLDKVLEITLPPEVAMIDDGLDLEFFLSINEVWGRFREVVPVLSGFSERHQETGMKDVMNGPGRG